MGVVSINDTRFAALGVSLIDEGRQVETALLSTYVNHV
jgi:hypothetical protein